MRKFLRKIKNMLRVIWSSILKLKIFKIDNKKIVFDNFNGKGFGDNPKYIALELIKEKVDCKMIWLVNDLKIEMPSEIKKVKYNSFRSYYELATAKIWIDNVRNYKGVDKKKEQFYIQTWHGNFAFKNAEAGIEKTLKPSYVKAAKNDGKITDLLISGTKSMTRFLKTNFWYDGYVSEMGLPKNDILYEPINKTKYKVYDYYKINKSKKIILYAPTLRKDFNLETILFDFEKCINIINKKFNNEHILLIRLHPNDIQASKEIKETENIINATLYPDIQELLAATDIGITDYSSIGLELAMLNKPVFLLCKDYENFISKERDLLIDINQLPYNINTTERDLYKSISNFSKKDYEKKCTDFFKREDIQPIKKTTASYEIVQIIKSKLKK